MHMTNLHFVCFVAKDQNLDAESMEIIDDVGK